MSHKRSEEWRSNGNLGGCICSQLRRTTRKLTATYDHALAGSGLTVSQYSLIVNIARLGKVSLGALAERVGMDRTSLTRSLRPLEGGGLVVTVEGTDRRQRLLSVSPEGLRQVKVGYDLWQAAQRKYIAKLGGEALENLREALCAAEAACDS